MFSSGADNGIYAYFQIFNMQGVQSFFIAPYSTLRKTSNRTQALLEFWLSLMQYFGIHGRLGWTTHAGFSYAYDANF